MNQKINDKCSIKSIWILVECREKGRDLFEVEIIQLQVTYLTSVSINKEGDLLESQIILLPNYVQVKEIRY